MESVRVWIDYARQFGFFGGVGLGATAVWIALTRRLFVMPKAADNEARLAAVEAAEAACRARNEDLAARIIALEAHVKELTEAIK